MTDSSSDSTLTVQGRTPYAQIPRWVLRAGKHLSHGAVRLYGVIMSYADNDTRTAFPGQQKLAEDLGVSDRSVRTYMKELQNIGALKVEHRQNKRTGNYYSNEYTLIFDQPSEAHSRRQKEEDFRLTTPTVLTKPTGSTSDQRSEQSVSPALSKRGQDDDGDRKVKAEQADPISPEFYHSEDRQILIHNIQAIAQSQIDHGVDSDESEKIFGIFQRNLETAFGLDSIDELYGMIYDYAWTPKRTHTDKLKAAIWLNQLLNEWSDLSGGLTWRMERSTET